MSVSFTRRARHLTFAGLATLTLGAVAQFAVAPVASSAESYTVPLHNTETEDVSDCPSGPDAFGWHFVLPGNETTFVSMTVTFTNYGTKTAPPDGMVDGKHAWVYTPGNDTIVSGSAVVTGGSVDRVVFSHRCSGTTATTAPPTTAPPTTVPPTTVPPTTVPPTTVPPTTVPPTTEVPPTTVPPTTEVPPTTVPPTVSATTAAPTTEAPTVLPTRLTNTPSPTVQGVKTVKPPAVRGNRLTTTGTPVPVGLLLLLGFGLIAAGVVTTVAGEPRTEGGYGKHRR